MKKIKILMLCMIFGLFTTVSFGKISKKSIVINKEFIMGVNAYAKLALSSFGKDFYEIKYINGTDGESSMYVDNSSGVLYININGNGFGNTKNMRNSLIHMAAHGTYADKKVDEKAATKAAKNNTGVKSHVIVSVDMKEEIENATKEFQDAKAAGKVVD
ncbi:hypothetical protein [Fusobacterium sp. PH5-44]|uniref:hypothetical protein n=1 Tax=unclassified Fusobacterium TaxID=2648384 RepID=UPI003D1E7BDE